MLQTTAAAGGAAALGTGAVETPLTATQEAEGAIFTAGFLAGSAAAIGAGFVAGVAFERITSDDVSIDEDDLSNSRETQTWEIATAITQGKRDYDLIADREFGESNNGNSFKDSAWSEVRTLAVEGKKKGWSKSETKRKAGQEVDRQAVRMAMNHIQLWNRKVELFAPYIAEDMNDANKDVIYHQDAQSNDTPVRTYSFDPSTYDGWEGWKIDDTLVGMKWTGEHQLPFDPTNFDGWEQGDVELYCPLDMSPIPGALNDWFPNGSTGVGEMLEVKHQDYGEKMLLECDYERYNNGIIPYLRHLDREHRNVKSDISTYVDTFYDAVAQGTIDAVDAISPSDLVEEFASGSESERVTAELAAVGLSTPGDVGIQAEISHRGLEADRLWGRLFVRWQDGEEKDLEPGTTIPSGSYNMAYFQYVDQATGKPQVELLSGYYGDLEILDLAGKDVDRGENIDKNVEEDGDIPVWHPDKDGETPSWIKNPPAGEKIVVRTPEGTHQFDPSLLKQRDDGTYILPDTGVAPGRQIDRIKTVKKLPYQQPYDYVKSPSNVDESRVEQRYVNIGKLREQIREEVFGGGGGGGAGGDWISQIIGFFGGMKNAVIAAVIAVVGASVIGALRG